MAGQTGYIAIIGDLIASRALKERRAAQQALEQALQLVNQRYDSAIAARFVITLGDEFQGLLRADAPLFRLLDDLEARLMPYPCRFGIGLGSISTAINPAMSLGADGEAFWHARDAILSVHRDNDYGAARTRLLGCRLALAPVINDLLALTDQIKRGFTAVQQQTFQALLEAGIYQEQFDQQALAKGMGLSPGALSRRLKLGRIKPYLRARHNLQQLVYLEAQP